MNGPDDEFDDFMRRRRPVFGRPDDDLEPPAELDRIVLRQARDAIEADKPQRVFRAPSWGMPVALAATLVLAFTIILRVGLPARDVKSEVTVQQVARTVEYPAAPAPAPPPAPETQARATAPAESVLADAGLASQDGPIVVDIAPAAEAPAAPARRLDKVADAARKRAAPPFVSEEEARRYSEPASQGRTASADQYGGVVINGQRAEVTTRGELRTDTAAEASNAASPEWRRDAKTWLAEIERLRKAGDVARADAELAEYNRKHRAYAVAPDR
jgi:hypothetical protein